VFGDETNMGIFVNKADPLRMRSSGGWNPVRSDDGGDDVQLATSSCSSVGSWAASPSRETVKDEGGVLSSGRSSSVDRGGQKIYPEPAAAAAAATPSLAVQRQRSSSEAHLGTNPGSGFVDIQQQGDCDRIMPLTIPNDQQHKAHLESQFPLRGSFRCSDNELSMPGDHGDRISESGEAALMHQKQWNDDLMGGDVDSDDVGQVACLVMPPPPHQPYDSNIAVLVEPGASTDREHPLALETISSLSEQPSVTGADGGRVGLSAEDPNLSSPFVATSRSNSHPDPVLQAPLAPAGHGDPGRGLDNYTSQELGLMEPGRLIGKQPEQMMGVLNQIHQLLQDQHLMQNRAWINKTQEPARGNALQPAGQCDGSDTPLLPSAVIAASPERGETKRPAGSEPLGSQVRQQRQARDEPAAPLGDFLRPDASFASSSVGSLVDDDGVPAPPFVATGLTGTFPDDLGATERTAPPSAGWDLSRGVLVIPASGVSLQLDASALQDLMKHCAQQAADSAIAAVRVAFRTADAAAAASFSRVEIPDATALSRIQTRSVGVQTRSPPKDQGNQTDARQRQVSDDHPDLPLPAASQTPIVHKSTSDVVRRLARQRGVGGRMAADPGRYSSVQADPESISGWQTAAVSSIASSHGAVTPSKSGVADEHRPLAFISRGPLPFSSIPEAGLGASSDAGTVIELSHGAPWEDETAARPGPQAEAYLAPAGAYAKPKSVAPQSTGSSPFRPAWASSSLREPPSTVGYSPGPDEGVAALRLRSKPAPVGGSSRSLDDTLAAQERSILRDALNDSFWAPPPTSYHLIPPADSGSWKRHLGAVMGPGMGDDLLTGSSGAKRQRALDDKENNHIRCSSEGAAAETSAKPSSELLFFKNSFSNVGGLMQYMPPSVQQRLVGGSHGIASGAAGSGSGPSLIMPPPSSFMRIPGAVGTGPRRVEGGASCSTWILPEAPSIGAGTGVSSSHGALADCHQQDSFLIPQRLLPPSLQQRWQQMNSAKQQHQPPRHDDSGRVDGIMPLGLALTHGKLDHGEWGSTPNSPAASIAASNDFMDVVEAES